MAGTESVHPFTVPLQAATAVTLIALYVGMPQAMYGRMAIAEFCVDVFKDDDVFRIGSVAVSKLEAARALEEDQMVFSSSHTLFCFFSLHSPFFSPLSLARSRLISSQFQCSGGGHWRW